MQLIITRALESVEQQAFGTLPVLFLPFQTYENMPFDKNLLDFYQYYIFTSAHAVDLYLKMGGDRHNKTFYCVGRVTAEKIGGIYPKIPGALHLKDLIINVHDQKMKLLYLSAQIIKHPLDALLRTDGFLCDRHVIYQTKAQTQDLSILPDSFCAVFYSRQAYNFFMDCVFAQNKNEKIKKNTAIFINPNASASIFSNSDALHWNKILTCHDTQSVLSFVQGAY
ncbi:MAG: hypothetical protein CNLJKLNK_01022 [Holosporales bacterium]